MNTKPLIKLKNTALSYGLVAIFFHLFMALGVLSMFGLGLYMVELGYYDSWYKGSVALHKSIGICLLGVLILRLLWRIMNKKPLQPAAKTKIEQLEQLAAHWMHLALYFIMFLLMVSGYLISTADGRGILVFDLFEVSAISALIENQEDIAGEIHLILAWCLIVSVAVHTLAAIKHHVINKDDTLKKMLGKL